MRVLILGCGVIGSLAGTLLHRQGHRVVGVRRSAVDPATTPFPVLAGDVADPELYDRLGPAEAVLLAANPGIRRRSRTKAQGNGLERAAQLIARRFASARIVATSSTSVYADAAGAAVDEQEPIDHTDPNTEALLDIEAPLRSLPRALVLRVAAIIGPSRDHARQRIRVAATAQSPVTVRGDPGRPFSWVHEQDLAELCADELAQPTLNGLHNVASATTLTVGGYYERLAAAMELPVTVVGDGAVAPSRIIACDSGITARLRRGVES